MEAIGAVEECNAAIGSALAFGLPDQVAAILTTMQGRLFIVSARNANTLPADRDQLPACLPHIRPGQFPGPPTLHTQNMPSHRQNQP